MIQCKNIELTFSDKKIFKDLNFFIEQGQKVCLSGPSGIGKSTLLKILQGYVIPDRGQVMINNIILTNKTVKEIREKIIWIPQNINLPVHNGWDLLNLMDIPSNIDVVIRICGKLGLEKDIISKDFDQISGGQKQRIITAICLSLNKDIILMDEPTSSLDDASIYLLIKVIQSMNEKTILSASHNQLWVKSSDKQITL